MLTAREAAFVLSACSRPESETPRHHLAHPFVAKVEGALWVVATDGHRLHAVQLPSGIVVKTGWIVMDRFGQVHEFEKEGKPPEVNKGNGPNGAWAGGGKLVEVDTARIEAVSGIATAPHVLCVALDESCNPMVRTNWDPADGKLVRLNPRFVAAAIALAIPEPKPDPGSYDWLMGEFEGGNEDDGDDYIHVARWGVTDTVVFQHRSDDPRWRAVVMPVRL